MPQKNIWRFVSKRVVHRNPWYRVERHHVICPNGRHGKFFVIEKKPAVCIVAVNDENHIAFIRQFRYPTQKYSIEIPAGGIDGEQPLKAGKRELMEETGLKARSWKRIGRLHVANGVMNHIGCVYLATGLTQKVATGQEEEGIEEVRFIPYREVLRMIKDGEITDDLTISSVTIALLKLNLIG
jgi:8-oxo-dGTP pyrophosphatase MutT (NUDIX family)